jgi:hypothetical protein
VHIAHPVRKKNGAYPFPSKYTGDLQLDRRQTNESLIDTSKMVPNVRERRDRAIAKKIAVCLDTHARSRFKTKPQTCRTPALLPLRAAVD